MAWLHLIQSRQLKQRFKVLCVLAGVALMQQQVEGKIKPISKETQSNCWKQPGLGLAAAVLRWEAVSIRVTSDLSLCHPPHSCSLFQYTPLSGID